METQSHNRHVSRVSPVHFISLRDALMDEIPSGEQASVQSHITEPRQYLCPFEKRFSHVQQNDKRLYFVTFVNDVEGHETKR